MSNYYSSFKVVLSFILCFILLSPLSYSQDFKQLDQSKVVFLTKYLSLTQNQKNTFLRYVKKLDENLTQIKQFEENNPEHYLLKLRSINDIFEVQVRRILLEDQHGRWKDIQNKEQRDLNKCLISAKREGWSLNERMEEEIKIRYRYTTLNI